MKNLAVLTLGMFLANASALTITESGGWFEAAFAKWQPVSGATGYNVYADGEKIHDPLIRSYGSYVRADIPGLSAGSHTLKVVSVKSGVEGESATATVTVKAHDRSGFAFNGGRVPGAYKSDGTLKDGALVVYITENTKNTVSLDVTTGSKGTTTCKSFQGILDCLKKGKETRPIDFRLVGNITDPETLDKGDIIVDLNSSENSYVTIEGVGEDATANGWGIRLKNANNVEIRNIGIMNVDSDEGDNIGLQQNNAYIWVHHNDFFYGHAGSDADQLKGDGALDCKGSKYVTFSYNHFFDNGKTNLIGLSESVYSYNSTDYYITLHHNWYDHSDSRHPRVRYYNAHVYNNFYDGSAKYGAGSTLGSSLFMEGNYFRNCKYPMLTSMQGTDLYAGTSKSSTENATFSKEAGGSIKAFNNYMTGTYTFIPYNATSFTNKGKTVSASDMGINTATDFDAYVVTNKSDKVPSTVTSKSGSHYYSNFDTDASKMYSYSAETPEAAMNTVKSYAGRLNGGDFKWTFDNSTEDASYSVNTSLKTALTSYVTTLKTVQGEGEFVAEPASSSSAVSSSSSKTVSSSSDAISSSSTVDISSSSEISSSSTISDPTAEILPIRSDVTHNFTRDGLSSSYFLFSGNLSSEKGTVEVGGETLTKCLKMESATAISFTLEVPATVTLYLNADFAKNVKIDQKAYATKDGTVTVSLDIGSHCISKGDAGNLFLIEVRVEETEALAKAGKPLARISFDRLSKSVFVESAHVQGVEIVRIDGKSVLRAVNGSRRISMKPYPSGLYIVRAKTSDGTFLKKIFVE